MNRASSEETLRTDEDTLQESEARFRELADSAPVLLWRSGTDALCDFFNRPWLDFRGRTMEEEVGNGWFEDGVHPEDKQYCWETYTSAFEAQEEFEMEYRLRRHDGEYRWILDRGAPRQAPGGEFAGYIGSCIDVTERRRTEDMLRASEERLSRIVETNADGIVLVDRDGRVNFANAAAEQIFDLKRSNITERTYDDPEWDITNVDGTPFADEELPFARVVRTGEPVYDAELAVLRPDGDRVILSVNGAPLRDAGGSVTGMVASFNDVTERRRAEEELGKRDAIAEVVRFAAERFLRETSTWEEGVGEVLERFGHATGVSRVYVFENYTGEDGELWATNTHEWVAPVISSQIDNPLLRALPYKAAGFGRWMGVFSQGEMLHGHTWEFPEEEQPELVAEGTLSIVLVPIFVEEEWWGLIGFDECEREREWSVAELDALKAAADTLGAAIGRNRVEQTLRRSRKKYKELVNTLEVIVWEADVQTVEFSFVSEQAERLLGYPASRWILEPSFWQEHIHPDDREWAVAFRAEATAQKRDHALEYRMIASDGRVVWLRDIVTVLIENDEPVKLRGVIVDTTERKRAEEEIKESRRALATLMSNLPGMAYRCNNDPDWTIELLSEGSLELTGYASDDLVGNRRLSYGDLIHADDREAVWEKVHAGITERRPFQFNYRITTASGEVKWVWEQGRGVFSSDGDLHALEGFITDVTERVQARELLEQRVEQRTRELSTLLEISNEVASTLELRPLVGLTLQQVRGIIDYDAAAISLLDDQDRLNLFVYEGPIPDADIQTVWPLSRTRSAAADTEPVEEDRAFGLEVVRYGKPLIIPDVQANTDDARIYRNRVAAIVGYIPEYIGTWMGVPLMARDRVIGMLSFDHGEPHHYTQRHADLALAFANHTAITIENARLFEQAQSAAALEERQRLARELHDSVSQALYGIALGSKTARTLLDRDPERAAEPLDYVLSLAEAGLAEMRALIFELRPESLENEGLIVALEKQAAALRARHEIDVHATIECEEPGVPLEAKETLYRIAQEALHNTVKHARASRADLKLECEVAGVTLEIGDDGDGFDPGRAYPGHLGLKSMRERAERLGGSLEVESAPGKGTRVLARIPSGVRVR